MPLTPGTSLGPYQIDAPLGAGGMGEVYKATDTRLDRTVAIKAVGTPKFGFFVEAFGLHGLTGVVREDRRSAWPLGCSDAKARDIVKCCGSASGVIKRLPPDPPRYFVPVAPHR